MISQKRKFGKRNTKGSLGFFLIKMQSDIPNRGNESHYDWRHFGEWTLPTCLMVLLVALASMDLYQQYTMQSSSFWFREYQNAVLSTSNFWEVGYRVENLELKLESQSSRLAQARHALNQLLPRMKLDIENLRGNMHDFKHTRGARIAMHQLLTNDSEIYRIRCGERGNLLRIGLNDFRTDERDSCMLFTDTDENVPPIDSSNKGTTKERYSQNRILPHSFFERVSLDEGSFALRPIGARGKFLQVVPTKTTDTYSYSMDPWRVVVGGPLLGQQERFRQLETGEIYSAAMDGFLQCSPSQHVKGVPGDAYKASKFVLEKIREKDVRYAQEVVSLSEQIIEIQNQYMREHTVANQARQAAIKSATGGINSKPLHICIGVPMTSKGTKMDSLKDSPFWSNLFDSFMHSVDWRSNKYVFRFYLGFDKADEMYDTGDSWAEMREIFHNRAKYRLEEDLIEKSLIDTILDDQLSLKLMHFSHLEGAPTQVVSQLMLSAYGEGFDYFYQVNDDTIIETANWAPALVGALAGNPIIPNFGVTGPLDINNDKIFTHSFVHRTHLEVFGHLFPPSFKNWWSDDWISTVYGQAHTFRNPDVRIKHNVGAQKLKGTTRYEVDHGAQLRVDAELRAGFVQVDTWLKKNDRPRLPLPAICGYIPTARYLYKQMKHATYNEEK